MRRLKEYFAFTKNEQKVFLFLSLVFLSGVAVKGYNTYIAPPVLPRFDYSVTDSIFTARSASVNDTGAVKMPPAAKVNLNTATKAALMTLPGVGETTAERILLYREENGKFRSTEELKRVKGIGSKKFEKLKPHIEVK